MPIHNKERCRDGCRTSLLIAGVVLVLGVVLGAYAPEGYGSRRVCLCVCVCVC